MDVDFVNWWEPAFFDWALTVLEVRSRYLIVVIKVFLLYRRLFRHIQKVVNGVVPVVEELLRGAAGAVPPVSLALLP